MNIVIVTPPPVEPVTIEEAFVHLRLDDESNPESNPDFAAVSAQITAAREQAEQYTRRAFVQQTLRLVRGPARGDGVRRGWNWMVSGCAESWGGIELLRPPLVELVAVRYFGDGNVLQTVDPAGYYVTSDMVPRLAFVEGFSAPSLYIRDDALQVEYIAGYPVVPAVPADGETPEVPADYRANVPQSIKQAILLGVQLLYDDLTPDRRTALEAARDALLSSYRIHTF